MAQMPDHIAASAGMQTMATDEGLARARAIADEYARTDATITELEDQVKKLKARRLEIQMKELPAVFAEIGVDRIGLPEAGVDVVVAPYYHANIASDWEPERREAAFSWLESEGHGDVVRATVAVSFARGELELARELEELIRTQFAGANSHPVSMEMGVPWNTLTALVREQIESGAVLPLETLGATVGTAAKIVKRKK